MRKFFILTLMLVMIAGFSLCQAAVSPDRMSAGGVYIGQKMTDVLAIYGKPISSDSEDVHAVFRHTEHYCKYGQFGTIFDVVIGSRLGQPLETGSVIAIRVSGNNGVSTKDGIKVGTPIGEVKRLLGKPNSETKEFLSYSEFDNKFPCQWMRFYTKNGVVTSYMILNEWHDGHFFSVMRK